MINLLLTCLPSSFESWFDIDTLGEAENVVATEREQNILSMLHQVSPPNHHHTVHSLSHVQPLHIVLCSFGVF